MPVAEEAEQLDRPGRRAVEREHCTQLAVVSTGNYVDRPLGGEVLPPQGQPLGSSEDIAARLRAGGPARAERPEPGDLLQLERRAQLFAFRGMSGLASAKPADPNRERRQRM